jgi:hypothetical protein
MALVAALMLPACDVGPRLPGVDRSKYPTHLKGHPLAKCRTRFQQNFRMTVTVQTPEDVRTASSVLALHAKRFSSWDTNNGACQLRSYGRGEAIPVDLGKRGILFVAAASSGFDFVEAVAEAEGFSRDVTIPEEVIDLARRTRRAYPVAERTRHTTDPDYGKGKDDLRPYFIRFADPSDWRTVERVDPEALDRSFGPGVRLKSLTVAYTDEPVTRGRIHRVLPWLDEPAKQSINPRCWVSDCQAWPLPELDLPYRLDLPGYSRLDLTTDIK